jgi:thiol-disulfide isomerase/thioredoxin
VKYLALVLAAACQSAQPADVSATGVELIDAPAGVADVASLVRVTALQLAVRHRRLVVYVGATWCEPCQQIHAAIAAHQLDATFPDLSLLVFDFDRDEPALDKAGYTSPFIPLFALPAPDGRASERREFGGKHAVDNVPLLTGKLRRLLD